MALSLCCCVAQPALWSSGLRSLGFLGLGTGADVMHPEKMEESLSKADALLHLNLGKDIWEVCRVANAVKHREKCPVQIAVILMPYLNCESTVAAGVGNMEIPPPDAGASWKLACDLQQARAELHDAGVDEVVTLFAGETLMPHRVAEIIHRNRVLTESLAKFIEAQEDAKGSQPQAAPEVRAQPEAPPQDLLNELAGRVLEHVPRQDASVREAFDIAGEVTSFGLYEVEAEVATGDFGKVLRARQRDLGVFAVKAFGKDYVRKSVGHAMALNRELGFLLHMAPHPNVVKAHEVVHTKNVIYCVMEFAGQQNLRSFVSAAALQTGSKTLTTICILAFSAQQAAAVSHLHSALVCHQDLKPEHWIVSDGGDTLRLGGFSRAVQLCGAEQPVPYFCGSLPYIAPEVLRSSCRRGTNSGHDGMAADIWSLGVGWMELMMGHRSLEHMLGWSPKSPPRPVEVVRGLETFADSAKKIGREPAILRHAIGNMLLLEPSRRCRISSLLGLRGMGKVQAPPMKEAAVTRDSAPLLDAVEVADAGWGRLSTL